MRMVFSGCPCEFIGLRLCHIKLKNKNFLWWKKLDKYRSRQNSIINPYPQTHPPHTYNLVSVYGQSCFIYTLTHLPLFYIILKQIPKTHFIIKLSNCLKMLFLSVLFKSWFEWFALKDLGFIRKVFVLLFRQASVSHGQVIKCAQSWEDHCLQLRSSRGPKDGNMFRLKNGRGTWTWER